MKKRRKLHIKSGHLTVILSFICVSAIALTLTNVVSLKPLQYVGGVLIVPLQKGINRVSEYIADWDKGFQNARKLSDENEKLQKKVDSLEEQNTILSQNQEELERLRELYSLDQDYSQYEKIGARVISKDPGNWYNDFVIDVGTDDGVAVDMNVMSGSGLVGIITSVGKNWAVVKSIIDDDSNVSAMTVTTLDTCIVTGSLKLMEEGKIEFSQMNTENDITEGEKVVTSNISDKYLEGILIGYVDEVRDDANHLTKTGYITPAVDFAHIHEVLVIKALKQTGGQ